MKGAGGGRSVIGAKDKSYPLRLLKVFFKLLFTSCKQYDAAFVGFAPQLIVPFLVLSSKGQALHRFFISMYDTLCFDRKKFSPNSFVGKRLLRIDEKTLKKADVILCDTKAHGRYFCGSWERIRKLQVLYLEADESIYYPRHGEKAAEAQGKFTVLYFGSVLPRRGLISCWRPWSV